MKSNVARSFYVPIHFRYEWTLKHLSFSLWDTFQACLNFCSFRLFRFEMGGDLRFFFVARSKREQFQKGTRCEGANSCDGWDCCGATTV